MFIRGLKNSFARQHLGEVDGFKLAALPAEQSLLVHQAAQIVGHNVIRAGLDGGGAFDLAHRGRDGRELRGKRAAEAAAGLGLGHFDELQIADPGEQRARLLFDAEFAQAVAAVVERDLRREPRAEIGHAEFGDQKIGKFPDTRCDLSGQLGLRRVGKQLRIKVFDHRAARTGDDDHRFGVLEMFQHLGGDGARFGPITGVEGGLAAAGDFLRANDLVAEALKDLHHAHARARIQRVYKTRNKQCDSHALHPHCSRREAVCHQKNRAHSRGCGRMNIRNSMSFKPEDIKKVVLYEDDFGHEMRVGHILFARMGESFVSQPGQFRVGKQFDDPRQGGLRGSLVLADLKVPIRQPVQRPGNLFR